MTILTRFEAVPSRLLSIYSAVADAESGVSLEHLASWATPRSLSTRGGGDDDGPSTALFSNSLAEARRLGLVEEDGDRLRVPTNARSAAGQGASADANFLAYMRGTLFDRERAEAAGQASVPYALAWLLTKSPLDPLSFSEEPQQIVRLDLGDFADKTEIGNKASYQNLIYWARYLGFVTLIRYNERVRHVIVDPLRAISAVLDRALPDSQWVDVDVFMSRLSEIYPILEGGVIRDEVEAHRTATPPADGRLSVGTSLALQRLAERGALSLDVVADARARILDLGGNTKRVSRVRRGGTT